jgi:phage virion morphogenesis protein
MSAEVIQIDDTAVRVSLGKFRLALQQKSDLMQQIGASMLVSIRRTFRGEGSPAGSWAPLAPSTIRSYGKAAIGHKLLVRKGTLLNSIGVQAQESSVTIGTNLKYAAVHQFGSRDRGPVAVGPRTKAMQDAVVKVKQHGFARLSSSLGTGRLGGRIRAVKGPRNQIRGTVGAHTRHQNIPARPYMVFRPEDPDRIRSLVNGFIRRAKKSAGLEGAE